MKRFIAYKLVRDKDGLTYYGVPTNHKYLIVNVDEPYAPEVFRLIKEYEKIKGTWDGPDNFEEFVRQI